MVSRENFLTIGYVYGFIGTLGFLIATLWTTIDNVLFFIGAKSFLFVFETVFMAFNWICLSFFVILLVGMLKTNLSLVKIHRMYLKIVSIITLICFTILMIFSYDSFHDKKTMIVNILMCYLMGFVILIVQYLILIWIVNGVIAAIQSEEESKDLMLCQPEVEDKQNISIYAPV